LAALVLVVKEDADWRAISLAFEDSGPDFRNIGFLALSDDFGLAGTAAAQVRHQGIHTEQQAGRAAVHDQQISRPLADAGSRDTKQLAEGISRHIGIHESKQKI